jgi:uncharacterized protein (TIGR02145 family)
MKFTIFIQTIILLISSLSSLAQDIIRLKTGNETHAIIKKVGVNTIEYVRFDNQNGPIYEILKEDISSIKYENGAEDYFETKNSNISIMNISPHEGVFIDIRDSTTYKWVKIGEQVWMAENMKYYVGSSPCIRNKSNECDKCGRYYRFENALDACPQGWHLPSDIEWKELEIEVGMNESKASKFGWRGTSPGQAYNILLNGSSGLNLRMCGFVYQTNFSRKSPKYSDTFYGEQAFYWTSTEDNSFRNNAIIRHLKDRASIGRIAVTKKTRYPIRCIKD